MSLSGDRLVVRAAQSGQNFAWHLFGPFAKTAATPVPHAGVRPQLSASRRLESAVQTARGAAFIWEQGTSPPTTCARSWARATEVRGQHGRHVRRVLHSPSRAFARRLRMLSTRPTLTLFSSETPLSFLSPALSRAQERGLSDVYRWWSERRKKVRPLCPPFPCDMREIRSPRSPFQQPHRASRQKAGLHTPRSRRRSSLPLRFRCFRQTGRGCRLNQPLGMCKSPGWATRAASSSLLASLS